MSARNYEHTFFYGLIENIPLLLKFNSAGLSTVTGNVLTLQPSYQVQYVGIVKLHRQPEDELFESHINIILNNYSNHVYV